MNGYGPTMARGALTVGVERVIAVVPVRLQYSSLAGQQTPLPRGLAPTSILQDSTGAHLVGDLLHDRADRTVLAAVKFTKAVASALPTSEEDEQIVDALVAKKLAAQITRPLRRRDPSQR